MGIFWRQLRSLDVMARGPESRPIKLERKVRKALKLLVRRGRGAYQYILRARIILLAAEGVATAEISRRLGIDGRTVRKWKARFIEDPHPDALRDGERPGRPRCIPLMVRCSLIQLACARPVVEQEPLAFRDLWTHATLAQAVFERTGCPISASEVGRTLRFEEIRPHRVRQWLNSTDPEFESKAEAICKLYIEPPKNTVVVCVDEKPMQVLERKYESYVDPRDGVLRQEYEYKRHGTQNLLAAFNVKTGKVFARVVKNRDAKATVAFMNALARHYRGKRVIVIWDNLNTHYDGPDERWTTFNARHGNRFEFVYTPIHASWMNQVEIWFSILQRRILRHGSFATPKQQEKSLQGFIALWNRAEAHPFRWTWRASGRQNGVQEAA